MTTIDKTLKQGYILKSPKQSYKIEGLLGIGCFHITYIASAIFKVSGTPAKIKFVIKESFNRNDCSQNSSSGNVTYPIRTKEFDNTLRKEFLEDILRLRTIAYGHKNIVKVYEVFETNNTSYYVMEYIDGISLRNYVVNRGRISEDEMLTVITPIVEAVMYLHKNRITHLDINPDNIMVKHDINGKIQPVLIGFDCSKHYDKGGNPTSITGIFRSNDGYSPKEQYAGISTFSPSADIYALGATMWFCLTGKNPNKSVDLIEGDLFMSLPDNISDKTKSIIRQATTLSKDNRKIELMDRVYDVHDDVVRECVYGSPSPWHMLDHISNPTEFLEKDDNSKVGWNWIQWFCKNKAIVTVAIGLVILILLILIWCCS